MSNLKNSVRLMGFLGNDPEVKTVGDNKKVVNISLATHDYYRNDKGERVEETQWHNLVLWEKHAALAEKFMRKGSEIAIEGKLNNKSYVDKEGTRRYVTEILVNNVELLGKKP